MRYSGQRPQHDRLDPGEHRGVDADPHSERDDDHRRQAGHPADHPKGMPQVRGRGQETAEGPPASHLLLDLLETPHLDEGGPPCFRLTEAGAYLPFDERLQIVPELLVQLPVETGAGEQRPPKAEQSSW